MSPGIDPEKIKALLAQPVKKRGGKKVIDTSVRSYQTWFALGPKTRSEDGLSDLECQNDNCVDPRPATISALGNKIKHQYVVNINGVLICRFCFLDGYLLDDPNQEQMVV
jgi:hypothetical protein